MIVYEKQGNIFESFMHALVCPVNTVGTMGKGLALQFKQRYPGLEWAYKGACHGDVFKQAGFFVWSGNPEHKVICLPSKRHWREPSRLEWIDRSLASISEHYASHGICSMAIPAVGCGEGRLEWEDVRELIYEHFGPKHPLQVGIYAPTESQRKRA